MALFRRRSTPEDLPEEPSAAVEDGPGADEVDSGADGDSDAPGSDAPDPRAGGPFDESEAQRADASLPRLDLGGLLIPGLPGIQVQVEADQNSQQITAVTGVAGEGAVQLQPFAAPRSEGVWDEIRAEMLAEISATAGARVTQAEGPFGTELHAMLPVRTPEGQQALQPLRFAGIDGPRWFLRAVFLGRAAVEPDHDDVLHTLVRQTIVVRGTEAMAPRDPLPLHLPEQAPGELDADELEESEAEELDADELEESEVEELDDELAVEEPELVADPDADPARDAGGTPAKWPTDLDPFERGPEITEIR